MLAATCIAVCLIPVTFYVVENLVRKRRDAKAGAKVTPPGEPAGEGTT